MEETQIDLGRNDYNQDKNKYKQELEMVQSIQGMPHVTSEAALKSDDTMQRKELNKEEQGKTMEESGTRDQNNYNDHTNHLLL